MCLYSDVQSSRKEQAELLRYKDGSLPFRYLGTPICIIEVLRKKSILLPSPLYLLNPPSKVAQLLTHEILICPIYPLVIFLCFILHLQI